MALGTGVAFQCGNELLGTWHL